MPGPTFIRSLTSTSDPGAEQEAVTASPEENTGKRPIDVSIRRGLNQTSIATYTALSVTSGGATLIAVAGSNLTDRTFLHWTPTGGNIHWGYDSSVTSSNGTPQISGFFMSNEIGSSQQLFAIADANTTVSLRVGEGM